MFLNLDKLLDNIAAEIPVKFQNDRTTFLVMQYSLCYLLTHWGRVTHICVVNLTIIGSDNSLSPRRHQAIIWINDGILLIGPLGTNFSEILIKIHTVSFKKMHLKMSSGKCRPFCFGLNVTDRHRWHGAAIQFTLHYRHEKHNISEATTWRPINLGFVMCSALLDF